MSAATASGHLQRMVAGGLVSVRSSGRHRYYGLSGPLVAAAIEALSLISPPVEARSLRQSIAAAAMAEARSCYDHLAGRAGIALRDSLLTSGVLSADGARDFRADRSRPPLPRGTRTRPGAHPAITAHAGPGLPRLDRAETASGRGASRGPARPLPRTRLARRRRNDRALTITDLGQASLPALGQPPAPGFLAPAVRLTTKTMDRCVHPGVHNDPSSWSSSLPLQITARSFRLRADPS